MDIHDLWNRGILDEGGFHRLENQNFYFLAEILALDKAEAIRMLSGQGWERLANFCLKQFNLRVDRLTIEHRQLIRAYVHSALLAS